MPSKKLHKKASRIFQPYPKAGKKENPGSYEPLPMLRCHSYKNLHSLICNTRLYSSFSLQDALINVNVILCFTKVIPNLRGRRNNETDNCLLKPIQTEDKSLTWERRHFYGCGTKKDYKVTNNGCKA